MDEKSLDMFFMEKRVKTLKKWPFDDDSQINRKAMAAAGFYFIGNKNSPDVVRCFICQKELDGWEEEDQPWEEHKRHAPYCQFVMLNKDESKITVQEMKELQMHQAVNLAKKAMTNKIEEFKKQAKKARNVIEDML